MGALQIALETYRIPKRQDLLADLHIRSDYPSYPD